MQKATSGFALVSLILIILLPMLLSAQDTLQHVMPGRVNSPEQQRKPYIILISADGFRYDLADKYHATNLLELRSRGVAASSMKPSYPSLTFPNHYSIATGLYPAHHGIISNAFYDRGKNQVYFIGSPAVVDSSWYGGLPIWVLAEQQQMLTASFYWVGAEAAIRGVRPTYYYSFNNKIGIDERIKAVKDWLELPEDRRPHMILFYLPQVDHEEHLHGLDSREAEAAVHLVDNCIGKMVRTVDSLHLPVNFIFVSDHGMSLVDTLHPIALASLMDTSRFIIPQESTIVNLYAKDSKDILPTYQALKKEGADFDTYLPGETPARWHYRDTDDRLHRLGDMILVPKYPKIFRFGSRMHPANHGFDNDIPAMQASFYAWGPALRQNMQIPSFENVDIYPLITSILGLQVTERIDGSEDVLKPILR